MGDEVRSRYFLPDSHFNSFPGHTQTIIPTAFSSHSGIPTGLVLTLDRNSGRFSVSVMAGFANYPLPTPSNLFPKISPGVGGHF